MSNRTTTRQRTVRLSKVEETYLANTRFLPEDLAQLLSVVGDAAEEGRVLRLDQETAERFRDEFTNRLARVGFGPDYEPTREGKLLEGLIDRFAS
jgi:hypothetical protein